MKFGWHQYNKTYLFDAGNDNYYARKFVTMVICLQTLKYLAMSNPHFPHSRPAPSHNLIADAFETAANPTPVVRLSRVLPDFLLRREKVARMIRGDQRERGELHWRQ